MDTIETTASDQIAGTLIRVRLHTSHHVLGVQINLIEILVSIKFCSHRVEELK